MYNVGWWCAKCHGRNETDDIFCEHCRTDRQLCDGDLWGYHSSTPTMRNE